MSGRRDVVVIGAGVIGAACAYYLSRAGAQVTVLEAVSVAAGTSSAGEGNLLVSDKSPGPELALALHSRELWDRIGAELGPDTIELQAKGGLMVAADPVTRERLAALVAVQRHAGVTAVELSPGQLPEYEPQLASGLAGGAYYPQDAQVQPVYATARLLAASGADVRCGARVQTVETGPAGVIGVRLATGRWLPADVVVNAAGVAAARVAATVGTRLPVSPRRGFILVTEALAGPGQPPPIRRKVYAAEYVGDVASDEAGLQSSAVVEGTQAGTVLIGASRERTWTGAGVPLPVLRRLARQATSLFPFLAGVRVLRAYKGWRPYSPDHLPMIGPDPMVAGLWHATGHEGAGIGLAPATGELIAAQVTGADPVLDPAPFAPARFG